MCEHINALINEAKRLSNRREQLNNTCDELESDGDENNGKIIDQTPHKNESKKRHYFYHNKFSFALGWSCLVYFVV